ncbi:MAG TPA: NrfD/PsrC family molybdoenzyme membrane anchor subunit [Anaerolineae bacterium]|nr:NrfD/PsrC family molybdoenzyme membrane anchor subunit [Anaerolineae bacterium]
MLADSPSRLKNFIWPHEDDPKERLLLDPIPQEEMNQIMLKPMLKRPSAGYWLLVAMLASVVAICLFGYWFYMMRWGMGIAGIRRPTGWGLFIVTFVFWIGISHSGTFVSAILRVFNAEFRRPITRAAELMTSFSLICGGLYPIIHLGRAWVVYWMVPIPNQRGLWGNFQSPLSWDLLAITTYLLGSTIYVFLPMIPDLAMTRDHTAGWRHVLYKLTSLGWRGLEYEWHYLHKAINIFAFAIIPIMFSVHTIVSWDFAMTQQTGWHSSIFGPYFVVGAILSGVSAVIAVLLVVRKTMNLQYFLRPEHFDALAKLVLIFSMSWTYFFFNDYLVEWYGGDWVGHKLLTFQARGPIAPFWYAMLIFNALIPAATLWNRRVRRSPMALFLIAIGINIGMYLERFLIIPGFLQRNRLPFNWGYYNPRGPEIFIPLGTLALFCLLYILASRVIPLIPVWEVLEGQLSHSRRRIGKTVVTSIAELE